MKQGRRKRMKREQRKVQVKHAVMWFTGKKKGYATQTDIAKYLGLTPSTHLLGILKELYLDCEIKMLYSEYVRGGNLCPKAYRWYSESDDVLVCDLAIRCELPWDCPCLSLIANQNTDSTLTPAWDKMTQDEQDAILTWHSEIF